ncbi:MAG: O-antigen ligase family protein [Planctomycetota bacterium]
MRRSGDVGLVACLVGTALALGGRHDAARFLYVATVSVASLGVLGHAAVTGERLRAPASLLTLIALVLLLLVAQVTPLPVTWVAWIAPATQDALTTWARDSGFGPWSVVSVVPSETREAIALVVAHGLLAVTLAQRLRTTEDVRLALRWIAAAAVGMALIGLAQPATSNGKLLWVYDAPPRAIGDQVQGTFANRNHFAHFVVLGIGPLLAILLRQRAAKPRSRRPGADPGTLSTAIGRAAPLVGVLVATVAVLATQSRGGVLALAAAVTTAGALGWIAGWVRGRAIVAAMAAGVVVLGALSFYGYEQATSRLDSLLEADLGQLDQGASRRAIWSANVAALFAQPLLGFGAGSHREVYPLFLREGFVREFTHAESGYLQVASETGVAGLALLGAGIALIGSWALAAWRCGDDQARALVIAAVAGLAASAVHSVVDFVWYLPALFGVAVALAMCLARLAESTENQAVPRGETGNSWFVGWRSGLVSAGVAWCVTTTWFPAAGAFHWDSYLRSSASLRTLSADLLRQGEDASPHLVETVRVQTTRTTELLEATVESDPCNARAHLRLAGRLLQRFEIENAASPNPMPIELIRDAVARSGFADAAATRDWLRRALGEQVGLLFSARRHAAYAVRLCPLQGQAYLYLARLDFLDGATAPNGGDAPLVQQALSVRPGHGSVLFESGRQMHLRGRVDSAIELWRESLARPGSHRGRLVAVVGRMMAAGDFVELLEPDSHATALAVTQYKMMGAREDLVALARYAERVAASREPGTSDAAQSRLWAQVSRLYRALERPEDAIVCSERALSLVPHDFFVRHEAAAAYRLAGKPDEADPHLRWCLARRPDMTHLHTWLAEGAKAGNAVYRNRELLSRRRRSASTAEARLATSPAVLPQPRAARAENPPADPSAVR